MKRDYLAELEALVGGDFSESKESRTSKTSKNKDDAHNTTTTRGSAVDNTGGAGEKPKTLQKPPDTTDKTPSVDNSESLDQGASKTSETPADFYCSDIQDHDHKSIGRDKNGQLWCEACGEPVYRSASSAGWFRPLRHPRDRHWMTQEEIRRYKEMIAKSHHLAIAAILKDRGAWIDKDNEPNEGAVFAHWDRPYKRCIHGDKYGCQECWIMREPEMFSPLVMYRLAGVPEPPDPRGGYYGGLWP